MNLFTAFKISAKGLMAERTRLNVASMNLANAHVTRTLDGGPYRAKSVVFRAIPISKKDFDIDKGFENELLNALKEVQVAKVVDDKTPFIERFDPTHPDADENGIVRLPNVNIMEQMVDLMEAQRAYEANLSALDTAKSMAIKALELIK